MSKACCVVGCRNESYGGCNISFHKLPVDAELKSKWLKVLQKRARITSYSVVCSYHFKKTDFEWGYARKHLKTGSVPSILPVIVPPVNSPRKSPKLIDRKSHNYSDNSVMHTISAPEKTCQEQVVIKNDPVKLEHDYDDNEILDTASGTLPCNAENSLTQRVKEEFIQIKEEEYDDHEYEIAFPSSKNEPADTIQDPTTIKIDLEYEDSNNDYKYDYSINLDHDYESTISSNPAPPIVTPARHQDPPTMVIGPLLSNYLPYIPGPVSTQEPPTMVIGPLPSSHLQSSNQLQEKTLLEMRENCNSSECKSIKTLKTIQDLRQKVKSLQHRIKRRDIKIKNLNTKIITLKKKFTVLRNRI